MTVSAPGYSCPSSAGSVTGSISASFLAGTTATTSGHASGSRLPGGSHWLVLQYPPCPATRYIHTTAAGTHAMLNANTPAASHTTKDAGRKARST